MKLTKQDITDAVLDVLTLALTVAVVVFMALI